MKELIKITNRDNIKTVDAKELHSFLEVGRRYTTWIQSRIKKYEFVEGTDFLPILGKSNGGRPELMYFISIDMAKELSMVENNDRGREARKYFIACEKELKQHKIPQTLPEALRAYAHEIEKREAAEYKVSLLRPKANFAKKALRDKKEHYSITQAGKHLGIGQKDMFDILRSNGLLTKENLPSQKALNKDILILRSNPDCNGRNRPQSIMTMENIYNFDNKYNQFKLEQI